MQIIMNIDIGNDRTMKEMYELPLDVEMQHYAEGLIKHYNNTIQSPFDMPRKLISVKEATEKDYLDTLRVTTKLEGIENCWISKFGQVFTVASTKHDEFIYDLIESDFYKDKEFEDMEKGGWVRVSTSALSGEAYLQSLSPPTGKQKLAIEKILLGNVENFFTNESNSVYCERFVFSLEDGKIRTRNIGR